MSEGLVPINLNLGVNDIYNALQDILRRALDEFVRPAADIQAFYVFAKNDARRFSPFVKPDMKREIIVSIRNRAYDRQPRLRVKEIVTDDDRRP